MKKVIGLCVMLMVVALFAFSGCKGKNSDHCADYFPSTEDNRCGEIDKCCDSDNCWLESFEGQTWDCDGANCDTATDHVLMDCFISPAQ